MKPIKSKIGGSAGKKVKTPKHPKGGKNPSGGRLPSSKPKLSKPTRMKVGSSSNSGIGENIK